MKLKVASLFSGIGGLDLGFEWAGAEVTWATDISAVAGASYPLNFGRPMVVSDILDLNLDAIPNTDIIVGGPPCQSFSLVGLRRPDDPRGRLVYRFLDIIRAKMPAGFLMENVPGISATRVNEQRLCDHLAEQFSSLGYHVTVMKLNAADYLVPQLRKRVFIAGSLVSKVNVPDPKEFARQAYGFEFEKYDNSTGSALLDLGIPVDKGKMTTYNNRPVSDFARIMRQDCKRFSLHEKPRMSETDKILVSFIPAGGNYLDVPDEYSTQRIMNFKRTGGRTSTYGRLHPAKPSFTVNTYFRRPNVGANFHPTEDRLITAREAMRLQAIPDRFKIAPGGAQDARNALIGNAVPPLLAHAVARELLRAIGNEATAYGDARLEIAD